MIKQLIRIVTLGLVLALAGALLHPVIARADALRRVSLIPQWMPQAQFAGYMVALKKGFYREAGLDLTLLPGGPGRPSLECVINGQASFATGWLTTAIQRRAAGAPLVNLAQIVQRSALMLVTLRSSGIHRPRDLNGKRVGLWGGDFSLPPWVFFRKHEIRDIRIVPQYHSIDLFLKGGLDAASAMWYNEYHLMINSGIDPDELNTFMFAEDGINFPEDGLYCREELLQAAPEVCGAFVLASLRGWTYTFEHPEEALTIVMDSVRDSGVGANTAHQRWMLARMADIIRPRGPGARLGRLDPDDYNQVGRVLMEKGLIDSLPPYIDFFKELP